MNDGVHAVNVEEVGQQVHQHILVGGDLLQGAAQAPQGLAHGPLFAGHAADLMDVFQHGEAEHQPPHAGKPEDEGQAGEHGHPHRVHNQEDQQRNGAAADVTQAVSHGGHLVHPLLGGHVGEKAVVIQVRPGKAQGAENVQA